MSMRLVAALVMVASIPSMASRAAACNDHAAGHAPPKLLDKSQIPANAFLYINKSPNKDGPPVVAPSSAVPSLPPVRSTR
jgi:hypothetical protein